MTKEPRGRWLLGAGAIGLVLVLVFVALSREPVQLDASSPEGVVQRYLQAISDRDHEAAFDYLDPDSYEGCDPSDLARNAPDEPFSASMQEGEEYSSERAFVEVTIRFGNGGGPFGDGWSQYESFQLVAGADSWLITDEAWPYFGWDCRKDI